jgi:hypothetical protein
MLRENILRMRKYTGTSIGQYVIIIALLGLASIPMFFAIGGNVKAFFTTFHDMQAVNNINIKLNQVPDSIVASGGVQAGTLGGSADNPIRKCSGTVCSIDYGSIVLNKIPQNFDEIVETTGSAGATNAVLELVQQVAKQIESQPEIPSEQLKQIQYLIDQGKDIITVEKYFEEQFNTVKQDVIAYAQDRQALYERYQAGEIDQTTYQNMDQQLVDKYYEVVRPKLASGYETRVDLNIGRNLPVDMDFMVFLLHPNSVMLFNQDGQYSGAGLSHVNIDYDAFMDNQVSLSSMNSLNSSNVSYKARSPVGEYLTQVKDIMDQGKLDPAAAELTNILSKEIYQMSQDLYDKSYALRDLYWSHYYLYNDQYKQDFTSIFTSPPSETTNMGLSIICSSSRMSYNPDNQSCN